MSVVYPYFLYELIPGAGATQSDEGDFVGATPPSWNFVGSCRDEVNTKGETVKQINGENVQITAIIYAPKDTKILPHGRKVVVAKEKVNDISLLLDSDWIKAQMEVGFIRLQDIAKGQNQTRLNTRIWV